MKMKLPEESLQFILYRIIEYANDVNTITPQNSEYNQDFIDGLQCAYQETINVIRNEIENRGYTLKDLGFNDIPNMF